MSRIIRAIYITAILAALIGGPWGYVAYRDWSARSFHCVEPGVLYRSGQLPVSALERLVHDYGIRTVVCLREGDHNNDLDEEKYCRHWGINHVRIPPRAWWASNGPAPAEQGLAAFRAVMDNAANYPVLIHCFAGLHRTGAYCAVYRMDYQGWTNADALAEMKKIGYHTVDGEWDILTFLEGYRPGQEGVIRPVSRKKR